MHAGRTSFWSGRAYPALQLVGNEGAWIVPQGLLAELEHAVLVGKLGSEAGER